MNESPQPQSPFPEIRNWWIAWTAAVVGAPALAMFAAVSKGIGEGSGQMGLVVGFVLFIGFITHIVASIGLARMISRRRDPDARTGAIIGLAIGLLFGGWAAMVAVFFVGCLGVVALG